MEELILKEREVKEQIARIVSNSGLPAILLKPMFKDFMEQLNSIEEQQYNQAKISRESKQKDKKEIKELKGEK